MLEKKYLQDADPDRGRFRSFLLTAVKRFLGKETARAHALKRGGGQVIFTIDSAETEAWYLPIAASRETPEALYERRWALSLLDRAMSKLQQHFAASGQRDDFQILVAFLSGEAEARYEDVATKMGVSAGALRTQVHRLRRHYREILRAEIAETVTTEAEIDEEIRFLLGKLSA
jgi:RNA polymerase sigma-70 factor (ECF subfamily)